MVVIRTSGPMKRLGILYMMILFWAGCCHAQDSFHNPYNFCYNIEYASEAVRDTLGGTVGTMKVVFDSKSRTSGYTISYGGHIVHQGCVIDRQLSFDRQVFILENFFQGKHNAKFAVTRGRELVNQKVAFAYYADVADDPLAGTTCICFILMDADDFQKTEGE